MGFQVGGMLGNAMNELYQQNVDSKNGQKADHAKKTDNAKKNDSTKAGFSKGSPFDKLSGKKDEGVVYEKASSFSPKQAADAGKGISGINVQKNQEIELSDKAKALLEELKEKYGNMDFFIANVSSDKEANAIMSRGTKEYSVLMDPETLEKMAADEDFKNECLSVLDKSTDEIKNAMEELGEDADKIESISIRINGDGTVDYFAKLRESSKEQRLRIEEQRKEKKAEEKEQAKKEARRKKVADLYAGKTSDPYGTKAPKKKDEDRVLHADSITDLVALLKERTSKE